MRIRISEWILQIKPDFRRLDSGFFQVRIVELFQKPGIIVDMAYHIVVSTLLFLGNQAAVVFSYFHRYRLSDSPGPGPQPVILLVNKLVNKLTVLEERRVLLWQRLSIKW
jgi:hypothetical protein